MTRTFCPVFFILQIAALTLGIGATSAMAAGAEGADVHIECPCSVSSTSTTTATVTLGVKNIGSPVKSGAFVQLYAHTTINNDASTAEFLGAVDIGDIGAGTTLASKAYEVDLQGPTTGTFFITAEIVDGDNEFIDAIKMTKQVILGSNFSVSGLDL